MWKLLRIPLKIFKGPSEDVQISSKDFRQGNHTGSQLSFKGLQGSGPSWSKVG